jgi:hypothetical protein
MLLYVGADRTAGSFFEFAGDGDEREARYWCFGKSLVATMR